MVKLEKNPDYSARSPVVIYQPIIASASKRGLIHLICIWKRFVIKISVNAKVFEKLQSKSLTCQSQVLLQTESDDTKCCPN